MSNYLRVMAQDLAERVRQALVNLNAIGRETAIYVWPREDRVVCLVDPIGILNIDRLLSDRAHHHIQSACQGRRVVFTNHRGAFIQVAYHSEPHIELGARPIDWTQQPSLLHVPIGQTKKGPLWLALSEMDAVLIGGARRMGKTRLIHSWIRALQRGQQARLLLWDGKNNLEFGRYAGGPNTLVAAELGEALKQVVSEVANREVAFKALHVTSLKKHNSRSSAPMPCIALIIDEAAFIPKEVVPVIVDLVARCGAFGIHPVLATQRPDADVLNGILRANLTTRIAPPVPSRFDSQIILGRSGAEKLVKTPGRLLIAWHARLIEAQAFTIELGEGSALSNSEQQPVINTLSADERRLVSTSIQHCQGFFKIKELSELTGVSHKAIGDLAKRWELIGWLTPVLRTDEGRPFGRKVTDTLCQLIGFGGPVDQGNQVD